MFEHSFLQARGFRNTGEPGARDGFELIVRNPNYRGIFLSLVEGVDVTVDGEAHDRTTLTYGIGGQRLSFEEVAESVDVRWPVTEAMVIGVPYPGGLAVGVHAVDVGIRIRASYVPEEIQPNVYPSSRKLTIVQP